jgi:hypothetical protein
VVELHHNDRSPTRCGGAPPHLSLVVSGCCSHSVRRLWWSSTTVCCCSQQFLLLRSSSTTGIVDSLVLRCGRALPQRKCTAVPAKKHSKRCVMLHSAAKRCWGAPQQREAAERSSQRATQQKKRTCLPAPAPLLLLPLGWGSLVANKKLAKSSSSIFCFCKKKQSS